MLALYKMFTKGFHAHASRAWMGAKQHMVHMYDQGRRFASKVDAGFQLYRKLHTALAPALRDAGLGTAVAHSKRAMDTYDKVKAHALGAHESAERAVGHIKRIPELGL